MNTMVAVIGDNQDDAAAVREMLCSAGYEVVLAQRPEAVEEQIALDCFSAVVADCGALGKDPRQWVSRLRADGLQAACILFGDGIDGEQVSEWLRAGVYDFIPRAQLRQRICAAVAGGLENRSAFVEITAAMDRLTHYNEMLQREKAALKRRNLELDFINRLTEAIAYELDWDSVLPKMLSAGLLNVLAPKVMGILFHNGRRWQTALYLADMQVNKPVIERLKEDVVRKFNSLAEAPIAADEVAHQIYSSNVVLSSVESLSTDEAFWQPLAVGERHLGLLFVMNREEQPAAPEMQELLATVGNILAMSLENVSKYDRLKQQAVTDPLTGIFNRQAFREYLKREYCRCRRSGGVMSLIIIDVDNFKTVNDSLGHLAGDYVLEELAGCMEKVLRQSDMLARFGGDEFALILPDTSAEMAQYCIGRLQIAVDSHRFAWHGQRLEVGLSCGLAASSEIEPSEDEEALIGLADRRLYRHKGRSGRCSYRKAEGR